MATCKNILSLLLAAVLSVVATAARNPARHYRHIIENNDVADVVMAAPDAATFWNMVRATDRHYPKTARSLARSRSNRDIKRNMAMAMSACEQYFTAVPTDPGLYTFAETVVDRSGLRAVNPLAILSITLESDIAVFSYPNAYMFMTRPLYDQLQGDTVAATALVAAEGAHFVLQHSYANACREKSRARRRRVARFFSAAALVTAGVVLDQVTGADGSYCPYVPWEAEYPFTAIASIVAVGMVSADCSPRYSLLYSPEQIHQADIIAYRFMEWSGHGGRAYIEALRRVGFHIDASLPATGAPDVAERIALLEYLDSHPELRSRVKAARRRPRPAP